MKHADETINIYTILSEESIFAEIQRTFLLKTWRMWHECYNIKYAPCFPEEKYLENQMDREEEWRKTWALILTCIDSVESFLVITSVCSTRARGNIPGSWTSVWMGLIAFRSSVLNVWVFHSDASPKMWNVLRDAFKRLSRPRDSCSTKKWMN